MLGNTKYSFWWTPKPVTGRRSTRAQKGTPTEPYRNVMYDKRVVRGSNYGSTSIELETYNKAAEWRRRNILRKKVLTRNQRNVIGTPPPIMGRRHEVIQTDKYLEELLDHPPVRTTDTQTDLFLEPPPTPPFVASKTGVDVGTAIEPGDLEAEVQTTKADEEDLSLIERFIEACIADTAQDVDLENGKSPVGTTIGEADKLTATRLLEGHVAEILPNVLEKFEPDCDSTEREQLMSSLCPWLSEQVAEEVAQIVDSHEILTVIIEDIIKQRGEAYATAVENNTKSVGTSEENGSTGNENNDT